VKLFIICIFIFSLKLYPQINKGWNLIGVNKNTSLQNIIKENKYITKALFYKDKNWVNISKLDSSDGIWVYSEKSFNSLNNNNYKNNIKNYISLKKGWNLKSIPMNMNISPYIINKNIYSFNNKKWMSFNKNNKEITNLNSTDGFWVFSKEDINISLKDIKLIKANFINNNELKTYIENIIINNKQFRYDYNYDYSIVDDNIANSPKMTAKATTENIIDATTTNLQEKNVDEIDVIKHNNKEIYFIQNGSIFLTSFEDILINKKATKKIIKFNDISLSSYGMYLYKNKLIVFSKKNNYNTIQPYKKSIVPYYNEKSMVYIDIIDVSDGSFSIIKQYEVDGDIFTSRISNNKLYIINSFFPNYKVEYERIEGDCNNFYFNKGFCNNINYDKYKIISKSILPKIKSNNKEQDIIKYNNFYINPIKTYRLNIMSVFSIDLETNEFKSSSSIDGNIYDFYASSDYVYLISSSNMYRNYYDYKMGSKIYSFSINDEILFNGEINIKGRINNKFSLSEYNGNLRVVSTQGSSWRGDTNNTLFIVKDNKIISSIENLGKEGETVKAVRFFGDKAFVVTFKQKDPLYILDLLNPYKPKKVSELEIPGFSTYFHYIDKNHLLSIGKDADKEGRVTGLQLQLFNISNLSKPFLQSKMKLGNRYSYSNALYESKSFVYSHNSKLLSIDYSDIDFKGFKIFKIEDKIKFIQDIKKDKENYYYYHSSILFNKNNKNYMGYINNENIKTTKIGD
jgi:uncharacterized secreted protein with C-terminal beta-propeller domain